MSSGPWCGAAWLVCWALVPACASRSATPAASTGSSREIGSAPLRPGAAIRRPFVLPRPRSSAEASLGLVALTPPVDPAPARDVIAAFVDAVVAESVPGLERLLERGARTRASASARPEVALLAWQRRFERLDYAALAGRVLYRASTLEMYTEADAAALASSRELPLLPHAGEVLVRLRLALSATDTGGLFGPEITLLLRRGEEGYKIGELFEDFRLP